AAGNIEQSEVAGDAETALDALAGGLELTRPCQRHADCIGGLRNCCGCCFADLRPLLGGWLRERALGRLQRALGPLESFVVVAAAKRGEGPLPIAGGRFAMRRV